MSREHGWSPGGPAHRTGAAPVRDTSSAAAAAAQRRAWLSLLLFPLTSLAAFAVGEGLAQLLGYTVGSDEPAPVWVVLAAFGPAIAVFAIPVVLSSMYGRRAMRLGHRQGLVPAVVGAVVVVGFVGLNLLSYVVWLVTDG